MGDAEKFSIAEDNYLIDELEECNSRIMRRRGHGCHTTLMVRERILAELKRRGYDMSIEVTQHLEEEG